MKVERLKVKDQGYKCSWLGASKENLGLNSQREEEITIRNQKWMLGARTWSMGLGGRNLA